MEVVRHIAANLDPVVMNKLKKNSERVIMEELVHSLRKGTAFVEVGLSLNLVYILS